MTIKGLVRVRSSYIKAIGYKDGAATVRFASGLVRSYPMSVTKWQEWMAAVSIGRFFNQQVRFRTRSNVEVTSR